MKKLLIIAILSFAIIGCDGVDWAKVETGAESAASYTATGEKVAVVTSPFTAGYGTAAAGILAGMGNIALAIAALAKAKKVKALAKAASEAAELTSGGGKALVMSSLNNGVIADIKKAYDASKKIGG
jgi:hypothetical protein